MLSLLAVPVAVGGWVAELTKPGGMPLAGAMAGSALGLVPVPSVSTVEE